MLLYRMTTFMILAFPILIAFTFMSKTFYPTSGNSKVPLIIGFFISVLYSFFDLFFFSAYYLTPYTFFSNFVYAFLNDVAVPLALCALFLMFLVKKYDQRWHELYFMLLGFYLVYFPARSFNINDVFSWYELFIKPIVMLSMVFVINNCIIFAYAYRNSSKKDSFSVKIRVAIKAAIIFSFILCLFAPAAIESLYMINALSWLLAPISVVYCAGTVYGSIIAVKKDLL